MDVKTLMSRTFTAWTVQPSGSTRTECRCTLEFDPTSPLEVKLRLWHQSLPDNLSDWDVARTLLCDPYGDPGHGYGVGDITTSMLPWGGRSMLRIQLRFPGGQIVVELAADEVYPWLVETIEAAPSTALRDWLDEALSDAAIEGAVGVWAGKYLCPRCRQVPRGLLGGCADPVCAAEQFRADLALDARIEATDD